MRRALAILTAFIVTSAQAMAVVAPSGNGNATSTCTITVPQACVLITAGGAQKVSIDDAPTVGTVTTVAITATSTTILAANANRKSSTICNTGNNDLYIAAGGTASLTNLYADIPKVAGSTVSCYKDTIPGFTGLITGVWSNTGSGNAVITSFQ